MSRVVWKGAIAFGLVNVPVDLYPGAKSDRLDFDWIDKRDMAPIGYQKINKSTGKVTLKENIVKGYEYEKGHYVLLSDEDFRQANPKATQTVEIVGFADAGAIAPPFFETPYRLAPGKRGEKGYALLREALRESGKVGIAQFVIRNKQHLGALMVWGDMLLLESLRWADEILTPEEFELPSSKAIKAGELELAKRLIEDMSGKWDPKQYKDTYRDDLLAQIHRKVKSGKTEVLTQAPRGGGKAEGSAQIIDLMAALKQSLEKKPAQKRAATPTKRSRASAKAPAARKRA